MIHFPSSLAHTSALPRRSDSLQLNATQQKSASHKIFQTIQEELHDARRVHSHGQEEDLRLALNMLIDRLSQLSTMLSDAYKSTADLEVQLNVAKSNLQLVISNNEMLEDALKREPAGARDVGWRRTSARAHTTDDSVSVSSPRTHTPTPSGEYTPTTPVGVPGTPTVDPPTPASTTQESSRFFKFRFTNSSSSSSPNPGSSSSRPGTPSPSIPSSGLANNLNSPSLPVLPVYSEAQKEQLEELQRKLETEKKGREAARKEKEDLEAELESLSQALFEEANKMVASERMRRADVEEELRQARLEKDALRSALKLLEGENVHLLRTTSRPASEVGSPAPLPLPFVASPTPQDDTTTPSTPSSSSQGSTSPTPPFEDAHTGDSPSSSSSLLSPRTKAHLPPSLSSIPKRLPAPEPLGMPTTPFDYSYEGEGDVATPRRRERVLDVEVEGEGEGEGSREEAEVARALEPGSDSPSPPPPAPPAPSSKPLVLEDKDEDKDGEGEGEEREKTQQHRPPVLNLFPHEHDPWADVPSRSVVGGTV